MANDWSREENEATVADYLEMLQLELAGVEYNKAEHRRNLVKLLDGRTDGAVERKHQNISAALIDNGCQWIEGYKPLFNYQKDLAEIVAGRIERMPSLRAAMATNAREDAVVPSVDDILSSIVDPPRPDRDRARATRVSENRQPRVVNYLEMEARNASLGKAGEEFVVRYEIARLLSEGADRLAQQVEHVSTTRGDGLGFDVLSFDNSGAERFIEVKTTKYGMETPFFVSRNELSVSRSQAERYHLYRLFSFARAPRFFNVQGQIDRGFSIEPVEWEARP